MMEEKIFNLKFSKIYFKNFQVDQFYNKNIKKIKFFLNSISRKLFLNKLDKIENWNFKC